MTGLKAAVRVHRRIAEIGREPWDACALRADRPANPFVSYDFLDILEQSGCAVEPAGWGPQHLSVEDANGRVDNVVIHFVSCFPGNDRDEYRRVQHKCGAVRHR